MPADVQSQETMEQPPVPESPVPTKSSGVLLVAALILVVGLIAYFNSFYGRFVYDDERVIVNNEDIRQFWPPWRFMGKSYWVCRISLAANYQLGGLDESGYHAVNLAVHLIAALALFGVVRRTLGGKRLGNRFGRTATPLAAAVATIWAVHPVQTQAVTYIIQRLESMMGMFYLLTLYCTIRGLGSRRPAGWFVSAVACCALGMGTKSVMVTAPVMVVLYDRVFVARSWRRLLAERWMFYVALAGTLAILWTDVPRYRKEGAGVPGTGVSVWEYAMTQFGAIVHYLRISLWPDPLCIEYKWPVARSAGQIVPPALLIAVLLAATIRGLWKSPAWGYLGAWFFLILAPTSSIITIRYPVFDHRMYLSLAAVVTAVVMGGYLAGGRLLRRLSVGPGAARGVGLAATVLLVGAFTARTINRNTVYYNEAWLWADVLKTCPDSERAEYNLGKALDVQGKAEEAERHYRRAVRLAPRFALAHNNLGLLLSHRGKTDEAIRHYHLAIKADSELAEAYSNLGLALTDKEEFDKAENAFRRALEVRRNQDRTYPEAHNNLARSLYIQGRYEEAAKEYRAAVREDPEYVLAIRALAWLLSACPDDGVRDGREAVTLATRACELTEYRDPKSLEVLSAACAETGRFGTAIKTALRALDLVDADRQPKTARRLRERLELYRQGRPCRDRAGGG